MFVRRRGVWFGFVRKMFMFCWAKSGRCRFLWPKTNYFVKLALYCTINFPPNGEVNSGESCFSIYQISRLRMNKLCLSFN